MCAAGMAVGAYLDGKVHEFLYRQVVNEQVNPLALAMKGRPAPADKSLAKMPRICWTLAYNSFFLKNTFYVGSHTGLDIKTRSVMHAFPEQFRSLLCKFLRA